jgi:isoleucyl-tRNA synthetase
MKTAAEKIVDLSPEQIRQIIEGTSVVLEVAGRSVELTAEKLDIRRIEKSGFRVLNEGTLTVALDTEITPELAAEGDIRDLIRGLQNLRKESGFAVSDRIHLKVFGSPRLEDAWNRFADFAAAEVLAVDYAWNPVTESDAVIEAGEETWRVKIERV